MELPPGRVRRGQDETTECRGSPAALTPCRALPGRGRARPPAGSALSAGATPAAAPSPHGPRCQSGFHRTFQVRGCGARGQNLRWFRPGSWLLGAGGCAGSAAPLTPASARPRLQGREHSWGLLPARESHFSPFHREQGREIRGTHPHRAALPGPAQSSSPGLPTPVRALETAARLPPSPGCLRPPQPCLPVLAVQTQNHTTKITSLGIAPEGPRQTERAETRRKQMRLDLEARRARSRQTC